MSQSFVRYANHPQINDADSPEISDWFTGELRIHIRTSSLRSVVQEDLPLPILLLHGIPTSSFLWRDVIRYAGSYRRMLAPDMLGFGFSDKNHAIRLNPDSLAEHLEILTSQWIGEGQPVAIVAHDYGALVASSILQRRRMNVDALVVLNTSMNPVAWQGLGPLSILKIPLVGETVMALSRQWLLDCAMRPFVANTEVLTPEVVKGYWCPFEYGMRRTVLRLYRENLMSNEMFDSWREALRRFDKRAMILWGTQDPAFGPELADLRELLPDAALVKFENASHFLPEERPLAVARNILALTR